MREVFSREVADVHRKGVQAVQVHEVGGFVALSLLCASLAAAECSDILLSSRVGHQ
jgi:hypothetical protein